MSRRIEVLYFESCPGAQGTLQRVKQVLEQDGLEASLEIVVVDSEEQAHRHRFLGSPTVRVDGVDVEPGSEGRDAYGLHCRIYAHDGHVESMPSVALIRRALMQERGLGEIACP